MHQQGPIRGLYQSSGSPAENLGGATCWLADQSGSCVITGQEVRGNQGRQVCRLVFVCACFSKQVYVLPGLSKGVEPGGHLRKLSEWQKMLHRENVWKVRKMLRHISAQKISRYELCVLYIPCCFHNTSAVNVLPHQLHPQYSHINVAYIVGTELRVKSQTCKTKESVDWSY